MKPSFLLSFQCEIITFVKRQIFMGGHDEMQAQVHLCHYPNAPYCAKSEKCKGLSKSEDAEYRSV
jgi:hypothetical protein